MVPAGSFIPVPLGKALTASFVISYQPPQGSTWGGGRENRVDPAINNPVEREQEKKQQTETNKSREVGSDMGNKCKQLLVLCVTPTERGTRGNGLRHSSTEQDPTWPSPSYEQPIEHTQSPGQGVQCGW